MTNSTKKPMNRTDMYKIAFLHTPVSGVAFFIKSLSFITFARSNAYKSTSNAMNDATRY